MWIPTAMLPSRDDTRRSLALATILAAQLMLQMDFLIVWWLCLACRQISGFRLRRCPGYRMHSRWPSADCSRERLGT